MASNENLGISDEMVMGVSDSILMMVIYSQTRRDLSEPILAELLWVKFGSVHCALCMLELK